MVQGIVTLLSLSEDGRYVAYVGVQLAAGSERGTPGFPGSIRSGDRHAARDPRQRVRPVRAAGHESRWIDVWLDWRQQRGARCDSRGTAARGDRPGLSDDAPRICPASVASDRDLATASSYAVMSGRCSERSRHSTGRRWCDGGIRRYSTSIVEHARSMTGSGSQIASIGVDERRVRRGCGTCPGLRIRRRYARGRSITDDGTYIRGGVLATGCWR